MALLVLIVLGATLGWLASVALRTEAAGEILRQIGVGALASVVIGLFVNSGTFLGGLSLAALGAATIAAIGAITLYHSVRRNRADA